MFDTKTIGDSWAQWALISTAESLVLLLILAAIWGLIRKRVAPQVGVWLFLLVPIKLLFPFSLPAPTELASIAPANLVEHTLSSKNKSTQPLAGQKNKLESSTANVDLPTQRDVAENENKNTSSIIQQSTVLAQHNRSKVQTSNRASTSATPVTFWMFGIWLTVSAFLLIRFVCSQLAFRSKMKSAKQVTPSSIPFDLEALTRQIGVPKLASDGLLESDHISSPIVWGVIDPKVVVPTSFGESITADQYKWAVTHELAHIKRSDIRFVLLQRLVSIFNWFNPAVWIANICVDRLREFACDDVATANCNSAPIDAGQAFVEVLKFANSKQAQTANVLGLFGFNRKPDESNSEIVQRLNRILDESRNVRLSAGKWSIIGLILLAVVAIPKLQATSTPDDSAVPEKIETTIAEAGKFQLRIVDEAGQPVPNANVEIRTEIELDKATVSSGEYVNRRGKRKWFNLKTNEKGLLAIDSLSKPKQWDIYVRTSGFGPFYSPWSNTNTSIGIPATQKIQLDSAWTVGGTITDEAGKPVEGADVRVWLKFKTRPEVQKGLYVGREPKTDKNGYWQFSMVPKHIDSVSIEVNHDDFVPTRTSLSRSSFEVKDDKRGGKVELNPGLTVTGTITDENGNFIDGALVRTKFSNAKRQATTGMDGTYRITGCEPRKTRIVVSAPGKALELKEAFVSADMKPVDFEMKPGGKVRMKVVDSNGKPLPNAGFFIQQWRCNGRVDYFEFDHVRCKTNEDGLWIWDEAPLDSFVGDIYYHGDRGEFMTLSEQTIEISEQEQVFKLSPQLYVSGKVTDAETGKPIDKFRVIPGLEATNRNLAPDQGFDAVDGEYRLKHFRQSYDVHFVRIEAEGYDAVESRDIKPDEGEVVVDFKLKRGKNIAATIVSPDGKPAAGASVTVGVSGSQISIDNGRIDKTSTYQSPTVETDGEGKFKMPPRETGYHLVVLHDSGFAHVITGCENDDPRLLNAQANATLVNKLPEQIKLTPWARINGKLMSGKQQLANKEVTLLQAGLHSYGNGMPNIFTHNDVVSGADGDFVFERVVPGRVRVARSITLTVDDGALEVGSCRQQPANPGAGESLSVQIGGNGCSVIGKLKPHPGFTGQPRWGFANISIERSFEQTNEPEVSRRLDELRQLSPTFFATAAEDGSFRVDDIPEGKWLMRVQFHEHSAGLLYGYEFEIKDEDSETPYDLKEIVLDER